MTYIHFSDSLRSYRLANLYYHVHLSTGLEEVNHELSITILKPKSFFKIILKHIFKQVPHEMGVLPLSSQDGKTSQSTSVCLIMLSMKDSNHWHKYYL